MSTERSLPGSRVNNPYYNRDHEGWCRLDINHDGECKTGTNQSDGWWNTPGLYKPLPKRCYKAVCMLEVTFAVVDQNGIYRGEYCTEHAREVYYDIGPQ